MSPPFPTEGQLLAPEVALAEAAVIHLKTWSSKLAVVLQRLREMTQSICSFSG